MDNLDDILGSKPIETKEEVVETKEETVEETANDNADSKVDTKEEKAEVKEPEKQVLVPHAAFHEERERRKELQKKLTEQDERNKVIEDRQSKILEALTKRNDPAQEQEYVDPISQLQNRINELEGGLKKSNAQTEADNKAIQAEQQLVNRYRGSIDAFVKDRPDFAEARAFLIKDKVSELKALDYTDAEIAQEIRTIEKQIVERAYSKEQNPADIICKLADGKGYKKSEAKAEQKTVEDIDKGLKASKSLGSGGKVAGSEDNLSSLSAEDLRDMSEEEFNALFTKLEKQSKRRA